MGATQLVLLSTQVPDVVTLSVFVQLAADMEASAREARARAARRQSASIVFCCIPLIWN